MDRFRPLKITILSLTLFLFSFPFLFVYYVLERRFVVYLGVSAYVVSLLLIFVVFFEEKGKRKRIAAYFCLYAISLPLLVFFIHNILADSYFPRGKKALEAGDRDLAYACFADAAVNGNVNGVLTLVEEFDYPEKAMQLLLPRFEPLEPSVKYELFKLYSEGKSIKKDFKKANSYLDDAAEGGYIRAQTVLATAYTNGVYRPKNTSKAIYWLTKAAENGDLSSQKSLGDAYRKGISVSIDYKLALKWYLAAANQDEASAKYNLAEMYEYGLGIEKNMDQAIHWYKSAQTPSAKLRLGEIYLNGAGGYRDPELAVKYFTDLAYSYFTAVAIKAQLYLGSIFEYGMGVKEDSKKAFFWYKQAADKGDTGAQCKIGDMYVLGKGVPKDFKKAAGWYHKAASQEENIKGQNRLRMFDPNTGIKLVNIQRMESLENQAEAGDVEALLQLGLEYSMGHIVPQDYKAARIYFEKAADQGDSNALTKLADIYYYGRGILIDYSKAYKMYSAAAEKGDSRALFILGSMAENGIGRPKDMGLAKDYYIEAAAKGSVRAKIQLKMLNRSDD